MARKVSHPHLLIVAPSAYPLGGVATWLDDLVPGLAAAGWRATVGLTAGRHHDADAYLAHHPFPDSVTVSAPTGSPEGRMRALASTLRRLKPDLALAVNVPDVVGATHRCRQGPLPDLRLGVTLHALQPDQLLDLRRWGAAVDGVVATNRLLCRLAETVGGFDAARVHYAPYGVVTSESSRAPRAPGARLKVGFSGRIEGFQKRAGDLAPIFEALDRLAVDAELWIAGSGPDEAELRRRLTGWLESDRAKLLGPLDRRGVRDRLYRHIDALLIPSFWETGPIVAWEAMAAGVPVVSAAYVGSGLEGSLRDGENCLLFPIGAAERAASCLARLLDPALVARLVEGGRRLVNERYSLERSRAAWGAALRCILESPIRRLAAEPAGPPPAGRLDRMLGGGAAETLRRLLGREFPHAEAGGEWPHTHTVAALDDAKFWRLARAQDEVAAPGTP